MHGFSGHLRAINATKQEKVTIRNTQQRRGAPDMRNSVTAASTRRCACDSMAAPPCVLRSTLHDREALLTVTHLAYLTSTLDAVQSHS